MGYQLVTRDIGCSSCKASGKQYTFEDLCDGDRGDINGTTNCSDCKGRKTHRVVLVITDETCNAHGSWEGGVSGIDCQNGTMRNSSSYYTYSKNFFGQKTRREVGAGQYSEVCPFCFGTGKKHYVAKKTYCSQCSGNGEINASRWEKSFFGNEVKREYRYTCPGCSGKKFSWIIDYHLDRSQIHGSNL